MARYRKINPRFWRDEKVRELTLPEKVIALYLFTGQSNRIGLFNFSPGESAEDLEMSLETFREGFGKVCRRLNFGWDERARVAYLPTWWKYNCPENPNVLKACLQDLHEIPQTPLLAEFSSNLIYLPETFHQTFAEGLPKPSPQRMADQEQEYKSGAKAPGCSSPKRSKKLSRGAIPPELQPTISRVVAKINKLAGTAYRSDSKIVTSGLVPRLKGGAMEADCMTVVESRWQEWGEKPEMRQYFNPETLFRESNFEKYLNAARMNNGHAEDSPERRKEIFING